MADKSVLIGDGRSQAAPKGKTVGGQHNGPVPQMKFSSPDGVVTKSRRDTQNGWYDNSGLREVED